MKKRDLKQMIIGLRKENKELSTTIHNLRRAHKTIAEKLIEVQKENEELSSIDTISIDMVTEPSCDGCIRNCLHRGAKCNNYETDKESNTNNIDKKVIIIGPENIPRLDIDINIPGLEESTSNEWHEEINKLKGYDPPCTIKDKNKLKKLILRELNIGKDELKSIMCTGTYTIENHLLILFSPQMNKNRLIYTYNGELKEIKSYYYQELILKYFELRRQIKAKKDGEINKD